MLKPQSGTQPLPGRVLALLGLFAFLLFLPGRASTPPFDRDEPRYMEATAQMLESGNFVDVRFQDKPRYLQPAGIYWLEAAAVAASGTLPDRAVWPYRVPSLLAMSASVMLTAWMGSVLFGAPAGVAAAVMFMVSVLVTAESRMGTIDSCLLLTVLLAQVAVLRALLDRDRQKSTVWQTPVLFWAAIGCGLMLKGPVILIPSLATPLAMAWVDRNFTLWRRLRPSWGWLISLAILLPWCVAIGVVSHGEFFRNAVGTNFLGKVSSGQQAHGLPPGYHVLVFLIAFWPGSFFVAATLPAIWKNRTTQAVKYLLCWILPHWLVFEAIATKLPHYVLPTYPAIAILTAGMLVRGAPVWNEWPKAIWARVLLGVYGIAWLLVGLALSVAGPVLLWKVEHVVSPAALILAAGCLPLIALAAALIWKSELRKALLTSAACAALLYVGLFLVVVPRLHSIWLAPRLADLVKTYRPCSQTEVASVSFSEPSLVFLLGGKVKLVGAQQAATMMLNNRACAVALVDDHDKEQFLSALGDARSKVVSHGTVSGLNYSNGHHLNISLYALSAE
ncbi:MAG: glycosyltransferase family 39 protein [Acetobacter indonesiensis]|nr:glycosyltransferase family 39 protein [Acetobacter indonesiensis]MCI1546948.1 glycosyltransferase family 39 protein [Acetobacter indonesiensis]MCI1766303.1 glycosyltransferase family 39 protein [Acetobacter indonesiensis]